MSNICCYSCYFSRLWLFTAFILHHKLAFIKIIIFCADCIILYRVFQKLAFIKIIIFCADCIILYHKLAFIKIIIFYRVFQRYVITYLYVSLILEILYHLCMNPSIIQESKQLFLRCKYSNLLGCGNS